MYARRRQYRARMSIINSNNNPSWNVLHSNRLRLNQLVVDLFINASEVTESTLVYYIILSYGQWSQLINMHERHG